MTATTMNTTTAAAQEPTRSSASRSVSYFLSSLRIVMSDWAFIGFIMALPTVMYLFFSGIFGGEEAAGVSVEALMMVSMATYGGLGSAISAGTQIQAERTTGWFRQLMLTALTPAEFFVTRLAVAMVVIAPPVIVVFIAGALKGVDLPITTWLSMLGIAVVVLIPFIMMGLVIGLWFKASTAQAASIFLMMGMSMLGGLWVPLEQMPDFMSGIGELLPSYWAGQFTAIPLTDGDIPGKGVIVQVAWMAVLLLLGVLGYRRAVTSSKR